MEALRPRRQARRARLRRLHGRGQVQRRPHGGRRAGRASRWTPTASSSASWASRSRRSSTARASRRSASARRRSVLRLLERARRAGGGAGRRLAGLRAGARGAARPHRRAPRGRARGGLAARVGQGPPAGARPRPLRPAARATARARLRVAPRTPMHAARRAATPSRRALPGAAGAAPRRAGGRRGWSGRATASGDYPVFVGRGLLDAGFFCPADGRRFAVTDENVAALHRVPAEHTRDHAGGRADKTLATAERVLRAAGPRRARERGDLVAARRRRRGGRPGRLLRRGLPARRAPRAGADDAGGPGGLRLRRQDRRRPARGQELRRRLPPAQRPCCATRRALDTLPAEERAAGYAEVVKTALIAGGPLWSRVRAGEAPDDERRAGLPAHQAGGGGRGRARRRAAARC